MIYMPSRIIVKAARSESQVEKHEDTHPVEERGYNLGYDFETADSSAKEAVLTLTRMRLVISMTFAFARRLGKP